MGHPQQDHRQNPWEQFPPDRSNIIRMFHAVEDADKTASHLSPGAVAGIARYLGLSVAEVEGVATFYQAFSTSGRGKHVVRICDSLSCRITGSTDVYRKVRSVLGVGKGETTPDGEFTLEIVNCLGSCDTAPNIMVDDVLHERVRPDQVEQILHGLEEPKESVS